MNITNISAAIGNFLVNHPEGYSVRLLICVILGCDDSHLERLYLHAPSDASDLKRLREFQKYIDQFDNECFAEAMDKVSLYSNKWRILRDNYDGLIKSLEDKNKIAREINACIWDEMKSLGL